MGGTMKTKHGKVHRAPVDQARKAERQRVIKKNKKERQQVRIAIAKHTDIANNLKKMLELDRQILGLDEAPFAVDVLRKKQKVILEIIDKRRAVLSADKDEMAKLNEQMKSYYAQVATLRKLAEQEQMARSVDPSFIPLPDGEMKEGEDRRLQLMGPRAYEEPSTRKEERSVKFDLPDESKDPPGPPIGLPLELSDSEDEAEPQYHEIDDDNLEPVPIPEEISMNFPTNPIPILRQPLPEMIQRPPIPPQLIPPPPTYVAPAPVAQPIPVPQPAVVPEIAIISSAPQIRSRSNVPTVSAIGPVQPTLTAKPQLRDLRSEAVKFVPLVLHRKTQKRVAPKQPIRPTRPVVTEAKSTEDAYNDFMKEISDLL